MKPAILYPRSRRCCGMESHTSSAGSTDASCRFADEVAFVSCSYRQLLDAWRSAGNLWVRAHADAIESLFFSVTSLPFPRSALSTSRAAVQTTVHGTPCKLPRFKIIALESTAFNMLRNFLICLEGSIACCTSRVWETGCSK